MLTKDKFLKSLKKQREIEGDSEHLDLLENIVDVCTTSSELNALVTVKFHRYGKLSYEVYRFYYPSKVLLGLQDYFIRKTSEIF